VAERALRVCALYPDLMNIYADRGNLLLLQRRCAWRSIGFEVTAASIGDDVDPEGHDLFYLGGGQDRDQAVVAEDLVRHKADALHVAARDGAVILAVCGGYQLAGHGYSALDGSRMPGIGLLDLDTVAGETRLIGNIAIEAELDGERAVVVGFENHAGRTRLGPRARPLGRVLGGHGNNGEDGTEGAVYHNAYGTYIHGSLLPKNPALADHLIALALRRRHGDLALAPLDDRAEQRAHAAALKLSP
jgi:hypothetical protein